MAESAVVNLELFDRDEAAVDQAGILSLVVSGMAGGALSRSAPLSGKPADAQAL